VLCHEVLVKKKQGLVVIRIVDSILVHALISSHF
jgi:hypothetical protein